MSRGAYMGLHYREGCLRMAVTDEKLGQEVARNEHTYIMRVGGALDCQAQGCMEVQLRFFTLTRDYSAPPRTRRGSPAA